MSEDFEESLYFSMQDLDQCLSRTAAGHLHTEVSDIKKMSPIKPTFQLVEENRKKIHRFICDSRNCILTPTLCRDCVQNIAKYALEGFGAPLWRMWEISYSKKSCVLLKDLESAMEIYYIQIYERLSCCDAASIVRIAAWSDFKLNVEIHPFYDACARTSRYVSAWILARFEKLPPKIETREDYWAAAANGIESFQDFYERSVKSRGGTSGF